MMQNLIATIVTLMLSFNTATKNVDQYVQRSPDVILATREFSLEDRYRVSSVNEVFKKNILLNIAYMRGSVEKKSDINWSNIEQPFHYEFTLKPNETFAYHDDVLQEYDDSVVKTTKAHFGPREGFVSDGYLFGDGVCHLASLINWVAQDAALQVKVTKNHNFAAIPDVPQKYGVSIYTNEGVKGSGARNNLYITNNKEHDVRFHFEYDENQELKVYVTEAV